jgi:hypothetical protein
MRLAMTATNSANSTGVANQEIGPRLIQSGEHLPGGAGSHDRRAALADADLE